MAEVELRIVRAEADAVGLRVDDLAVERKGLWRELRDRQRNCAHCGREGAGGIGMKPGHGGWLFTLDCNRAPAHGVIGHRLSAPIADAAPNADLSP